MTEISEQLFKCFGPCKEMKPDSEFPHHAQPYKGKIYRLSWCKRCRTRRYYPIKTVPVSRVLPYLHEIVYFAGSKRGAARELGITVTQLRQWMGISARYYKGRKQYVTSIYKDSAARIVNTLRRLRQSASKDDLLRVKKCMSELWAEKERQSRKLWIKDSDGKKVYMGGNSSPRYDNNSGYPESQLVA